MLSIDCSHAIYYKPRARRYPCLIPISMARMRLGEVQAEIEANMVVLWGSVAWLFYSEQPEQVMLIIFLGWDGWEISCGQ